MVTASRVRRTVLTTSESFDFACERFKERVFMRTYETSMVTWDQPVNCSARKASERATFVTNPPPSAG